MKIDICITCDDNYVKYCATVMASILENKATDDEPVFHILYGELSADNIQKLSNFPNVILYKVDDSFFSPYLKNAKLSWPVAALYRLKIASILNLDKVIYLDCDVIVTSSLKSYFEQDIEGYYMGAVPDVNYQAYMERLNIPQENGFFYFNAGSLLINLKQFREDNIEEKLFECMADIWENSTFLDQDVLNVCLYKNVKKLDKRYNYIPTIIDITMRKMFDVKEEVSVIHYAGYKPWELAFRANIRDEFWKYYKNSGCVSEKRFKKEYNTYKMWNQPLFQFCYLLKLYPLGLFVKGKRDLYKKVLFR